MVDYNEAIKNLQTIQGMPLTIRMAIKALEKQIPKKPIRSEYDGNCWCPSCNSADVMDIYYNDFCPDCGQAIDWSDE